MLYGFIFGSNKNNTTHDFGKYIEEGYQLTTDSDIRMRQSMRNMLILYGYNQDKKSSDITYKSPLKRTRYRNHRRRQSYLNTLFLSRMINLHNHTRSRNSSVSS